MVEILKGAAEVTGLNLRSRARPWERTGTIDVEALAQWAYGEQMVDRFERVGLHAIEAAVAGYEPRGFSGDGVGQLMAIHNLGCRVDGGGARISDAVHPVAYAVAEAVASIEHGRIVRAHALAGSRPTTWQPPAFKVRPAMWSKPGREAVVEYQGPGRKGAYCQIIIAWDAARQQWGKAEYAKWHLGLEDLAWALSLKPLGFTVLRPAAPAEPWHAASTSSETNPPSGSSHTAQQ